MPRSNEPDGEDKREDRGHGLRPEAKWVVLLGVLASAATVLTFVVVMGPTLLHFIVPVPTPSPSPSPTPTQSTLHVQKSPVPTPPSPASDPASPPVVPSDFDDVATDPTQVGVATMLPQRYHDSGTAFDRTSGWVPLCPTGNATAGVRGTLSHYGCTSEVVGTYFARSLGIQVAVWVIPLPDKTDADGADTVLTASGVPHNWGIWCPGPGVVGSRVCREPWQAAAQGVQIDACHRYLMRALSLYVNLRSDSAVQPVLTSAADAAVSAIGPQNVPVAHCGPVSAGS